jgi:hypothetical protein
MLILTHDRRKIVRFDVSQHPTAGWLSRQVTEAFPWNTTPRFLLRDRDAWYGSIFRKRVEAMVHHRSRNRGTLTMAERVRRASHRFDSAGMLGPGRHLQRAPSPQRSFLIR